MKTCIVCSTTLKTGKQYCSTDCQYKKYRADMVELWLAGKHNGMKGKTATAGWIKSYLKETRGNCCELCGWNETNKHTGKIPIELNHMDGDYTNNKINNLQLICPNCHSLTDSYKGANKKPGRPRSKYYRGL